MTGLDGNSSSRAQLEVQRIAGQSSATTSRAASPMTLLVPRPSGPSVWAYTGNLGGGLVAGDQTRLDLNVGPCARCFLSTQASTKIYRNPTCLPCGHTTRATVAPEAVLVFAPDPVQAFAGSIYFQNQEWRLASAAGLVLLDWFSSGRQGRGERWAFARFQSRNQISVDGQTVFLDSLLLDSSAQAIDAPHRTGRFNCFAMLVFMGVPLRSLATQLLDAYSSLPVQRRAPLLSSASPITDGALLRLAGERVEDVSCEIRRQLQPLSRLLGDDPWLRKW